MHSQRSFPLATWWDLVSAAAMAGLGLVYLQLLPRLPDPVPTHFNLRGQADGWTSKAHLPWFVFGLPLLVWLAVWGIGWLSARRQREPVAQEAAGMHPVRGLLGLGMAGLMAATLAIPLHGLVVLHAALGGFFLCILTGLAITVRKTRQALSDQPDARFHRWGFFYVNPEDPRLWVEKRLGLGMTLNYARPAAWWITALFLSPVALLLGGMIWTGCR